MSCCKGTIRGYSINTRNPACRERRYRWMKHGVVRGYVDHYNNVRLNSATDYITPKDMLAGRQREIDAERDRKLEAARKQWQILRKQAG